MRTLAASISLLSILIGNSKISAQNYVDIARLYYNTTEQNQFDNSASSTRINEFGIDITYPIVLNSKWIAITGVLAEQTSLRIVENEPTIELTSFTFRAGFIKKHSERWSGTYLIIPKLASDFSQSGSGNFQMGAVGLMKYNKNEVFNYKIGLYYNTELFGNLIVPIFGFYYGGPEKKWEANVLLPGLVDFNYRVVDWLDVGLNFTGQIRSYRLNALASNSQAGYVTKTSNEICPYLKFNFNKNLILMTRVGYSVGRSYRMYDEEDKIDLGISLIKIGNNRTQLNSDIADGFLFQSILVYRFVQN
jgi:hypothetical protein